MQISTQDAVRLGFVLDENKQIFDHTPYVGKSSFDIEVKEVLVKDENDHIKGEPSVQKLQPQDSAYIISKQYIRVPKGYVAYVFLKNRMSQRGLLALNTGIIDQNYYGPISTLILNLSKLPASIPDHTTPNDLSFFRVVFHKIDSNTPIDESRLEFPPESKAYEYQKYVSYRHRELTALPKTFLNAEEIENRIKSEVTEKTKEFSINRLLGGVAIIGLLLTLVPIGRDSLFSWQFDFNKITEQSIKNEYEAKILKMEVDSLKSEISALKKSIEKSKVSNANNSQPLFTQNLNITTPSNIERGAVSEEVVESLFFK
ncbi:dUTPase domain-containing protein [Vibrio chagasii]|nr:dUTPase domain-containing protein [Vibrio chagasii]CAH7015888.1 dUTPase domain-containing protein [Vibrio chagasii]